MATTANRQCKAKNRRGEPCGAFAVADSDYCYWHDPTKARERAEARRRGGQARHGRRISETEFRPPVRVSGVDDIMSILERTILDLLRLENSISRARALIYAASVGLKALEVGELEERIAVLEQKLSRG